MSVNYAISNTHTYVQGGLEISCSTSTGSATVTAKLYFRRTNSYSGSTYSSSVRLGITIDGSTTSSTTSVTVAGGQQNTWQGSFLSASKTFTSSGGSKTITISWSSTDNVSSYFSGSGSTSYSFTIPTSYTAPSGLSASVSSVTEKTVTLAVSLSSYGNPSSTSGRYIEGGVLTSNGTYASTARLIEQKTNTSSATFTISDSSTALSGGFTFKGNTKYYYGAYASNTQKTTSVVSGATYTLCPALSALTVGSQAYITTRLVSVTINWTRQSDGGALTRTLYYRLSTDGGSSYGSWTSVGTVTATSSTFTISGVECGKTCKVQARLSTTAGNSDYITSDAFTTLENQTKPYTPKTSPTTPEYAVNLYYDDILLGDIRELAVGLNWVKRRTSFGVDEISFSLNDALFGKWCREHNTTLASVLKPYALSCRVVRDGVELIGGFLATMPAYSPSNASATLSMVFDGWMNLLAGVYIRPTASTTLPAHEMVQGWISDADSRAKSAGKAFGFSCSYAIALSSITRTFDNYKTVKDAITDLCDNVDGAGEFDVIFNPDKTYYITNALGRTLEWALRYPTLRNSPSATSISAPEVQGFASHVIALGSGEVSSDTASSTVTISEETNSSAVASYGYCEKLVQYSSVSTQSVLDGHCTADLAEASNIGWMPRLTLAGRQISPNEVDNPSIWIGDILTLQNDIDETGQTSGMFKVNELSVSVSGTNAETITPTLERV